MLFADAPKALMEKIEQVIRLVRSKGVGVYFISQNPLDIPDIVLGQLGNRVQHALRAFTPRDQKAVNAAAETFRSNPKLKVEKAILELAVGEALVSMLDEKGTPSVVERAFVLPPQGQIGPITPEQRKEIIKGSLVYGHYEQLVDRESAYEKLRNRAGERVQQSGTPSGPLPKPAGTMQREAASMLEAAAKSVVRAAGSQLGRQIMRGVLGSILGGRK